MYTVIFYKKAQNLRCAYDTKKNALFAYKVYWFNKQNQPFKISRRIEDWSYGPTYIQAQHTTKSYNKIYIKRQKNIFEENEKIKLTTRDSDVPVYIDKLYLLPQRVDLVWFFFFLVVVRFVI